MERRNALKLTALTAGAVALNACNQRETEASTKDQLNPVISKVKHSACKWCYPDIPLEEMAEKAADIGLKSIELLNPDEWDLVLNKGLTCAISNGSPLGITKGFNDIDNHGQLLQDYAEIIPSASERGIEQIICFSGNRNGMTDEEGLEQCAVGLEPVLKLAEKYNVKIVMELLNSKIDHIDYQCDHMSWGSRLVEKLGSTHFGLLYDIYHMQIMEGDVIRTIRDNIKYISHFHTGGVPGRNEIDQTQELNYAAIVKAIMDTGYTGFVSQEFIPKASDPLKSLRKAIEICNV